MEPLLYVSPESEASKRHLLGFTISSTQKEKSTGNKNPTKKFTPETSLFLCNHCCQDTSRNTISCFPRTACKERRAISGQGEGSLAACARRLPRCPWLGDLGLRLQVHSRRQRVTDMLGWLACNSPVPKGPTHCDNENTQVGDIRFPDTAREFCPLLTLWLLLSALNIGPVLDPKQKMP